MKYSETGFRAIYHNFCILSRRCNGTCCQRRINARRRWVRITDLGDKYFVGTLLNEPNQDFGYHMDDKITFFICSGEGDKNYLISNMNETR